MWHKKLYHLKPLENPPKYSKEDKIKMAWALATDGSIGIGHSTGNQEYCHIRPFVTFTNTNEQFVEKFLNISKMGIIIKRERPKPHKDKVTWIIGSFLEVLYLLKKIEPHLPIKRKQAQLIMEFIESRIKRGILQKRNVPYSEREFEICEEVKLLNKRGK